jgi:hypothetical protein
MTAAATGFGALTIGAVVVMAALALRPSVGPAANGPVTATTDDGVFRLTVSTPQGTYGPTEAIAPVATLTYLGPDPEVTIFHAAHPIGFRIEGVGNDRVMGGGTRLPCRSTDLAKDQPITQAFGKGGSPDEVFDRAWYEDPILRLPAGTWRIVAILNIKVGDGCRGIEHPLEVTNLIRVVDGAPSPIETGAPLPSAPAESPTSSAVPSASASAEPVVPTPSDGPVTRVTDDGSFRFELAMPSSRYTTADEIDPITTVTYLGPNVTNVFHAASPILFRIDEVGGERVMGGGMDLPCQSTMFTNGAGKPYPFEKAGSPTDDLTTGFDRAWYEDPVLRLPAGQWRIMAQLDVTLGGCGADAERHQLTLSAQVTVVPATFGDEPVSESRYDGTLRLTLTTPHGIYGPSDAIEPIATVSYLGPDAETTIHHGGSPVLFSIEEVGGDRRMDGLMNLPCLRSTVDQAAPLTFPFVKSGGIGESFDRPWFDDPVLRLPVGTWRIRVALIADTTDGTDTCGGIPHKFDVDNVITVR